MSIYDNEQDDTIITDIEKLPEIDYRDDLIKAWDNWLDATNNVKQTPCAFTERVLERAKIKLLIIDPKMNFHGFEC